MLELRQLRVKGTAANATAEWDWRDEDVLVNPAAVEMLVEKHVVEKGTIVELMSGRLFFVEQALSDVIEWLR